MADSRIRVRKWMREQISGSALEMPLHCLLCSGFTRDKVFLSKDFIPQIIDISFTIEWEIKSRIIDSQNIEYIALNEFFANSWATSSDKVSEAYGENQRMLSWGRKKKQVRGLLLAIVTFIRIQNFPSSPTEKELIIFRKVDHWWRALLHTSIFPREW